MSSFDYKQSPEYIEGIKKVTFNKRIAQEKAIKILQQKVKELENRIEKLEKQ